MSRILRKGYIASILSNLPSTLCQCGTESSTCRDNARLFAGQQAVAKARSQPTTPMKMRNKSDLPNKTCPVCGVPFAWRKQWERDQEQACIAALREFGYVHTAAIGRVMAQSDALVPITLLG